MNLLKSKGISKPFPLVIAKVLLILKPKGMVNAFSEQDLFLDKTNPDFGNWHLANQSGRSVT